MTCIPRIKSVESFLSGDSTALGPEGMKVSWFTGRINMVLTHHEIRFTDFCCQERYSPVTLRHQIISQLREMNRGAATVDHADYDRTATAAALSSTDHSGLLLRLGERGRGLLDDRQLLLHHACWTVGR